MHSSHLRGLLKFSLKKERGIFFFGFKETGASQTEYTGAHKSTSEPAWWWGR